MKIRIDSEGRDVTDLYGLHDESDRILEVMKSPITILIDTAEQHPFSFTSIKADAKDDYQPLAVDTVRQCLGRHPDSLGDYSFHANGIGSAVGRCHIERKSIEDLQSTILGFNDGHRQRFEQELANLDRIESGMVLVEANEIDVVANAPEYGKKTKQQNAKILFRSLISFRQRFPRVQWCFAGSRSMAELYAYWFFFRFYEKEFLKPKSILDEV